MNILIIDRDPLTVQFLSKRIIDFGHTVTVEDSKQVALELMQKNIYDVIIIDPLPLTEARPVILGIFKAIKNTYNPYIFLFSKTIDQKEAIQAGANDLLCKPLNTVELETNINNAQRLLGWCRDLSTGEEYDSERGMIGKIAFNELFLSSIDRSHRYGERSCIVFVKLENDDAIKKQHGEEITEKFNTRLTKKIVRMRRQSDVVGRIGLHEYAILLQRPIYESEPFDAADRFSELLTKFCGKAENIPLHPQITLSMVEVPIGIAYIQDELINSETAAPKKVNLED